MYGIDENTIPILIFIISEIVQITKYTVIRLLVLKYNRHVIYHRHYCKRLNMIKKKR